jgi:hypothetical protein
MPFLTKKTANMKLHTLFPTGVETPNSGAWSGDIYIPSGQIAGWNGGEREDWLDEPGRRRACGSITCSGGWIAPWRNRRRPIFEGHWGCCGRCVLAMVEAAVRREAGYSGSPAVAPHRHRVPLGLLMLAQGWITNSQLQRALAAQRQSGVGRIGDWLKSECGLEPEKITRGLSMQWGCPVLSLKGFAPEPMSLVMPKVFVETFGLLPLRVAGSTILYLAFSDRLDPSAALATEHMTGLKVESGVVDGDEFVAGRSMLLACEGVELKQESVDGTDTMAARITAILEQKQPVASRLVRFHQYYWLRIWLERGATRSSTIPLKSEDVMDYVFNVRAQ